MKSLERLFFFLFPLARLKGSPWEATWLQQEKTEFVQIAKIFFSITFVGYILHYYTVDRAEGLAPSDLWFRYRFGMAGISALCLAFYSMPSLVNRVFFYRLPAIIAGAMFCYFQNRSIIWYPKVPYLYSFAFILVSVIILRTSILKSLVTAILFSVLIFPTLLETGLSPAMAASACFFTLAFVVFARSKYATDLNYFMATQKNILQQKKMIEINLEFTNQIRAFLPREISKRLNHRIQSQRMSVVQSIDEVLRPKQQQVACLFSDIRGFTKGSNDLHGYVSKAVFPNVKASSLAIEKFSGIPRKIGDLIFAYFDFEEAEQSIEMAMRAAIEIANINAEMNAGLVEELRIKRFILLSFGEAIVGNLSGYDSSIEITAIGSPVNYLSRIDELTKHEGLKNKLLGGDIIISKDMKDQISKKFPMLEMIELNLKNIGLKVRDFEQTEFLYVFRLGDIMTETAEKRAV
jgi:class 3 adenylate cyclase